MPRAKLKKLGIDLPVFPTTSVGSLPKPEALKQARNDFAQGKIGREELKRKEKEATHLWIRRQEEIDIDVLVDGEMDRDDPIASFAEAFEGFESSSPKPVLVRPVKWKGPITVTQWQFAKKLTVRPVKGIVTGPNTLMDGSLNEYYPDRRVAVLAIAKEIRKEIEALVQAGTRIIQIDEPALSTRPAEFSLAREALEICTRDLPAYFITHLCCGDFQSFSQDLFSLPVDNLDLEFSKNGPNLGPLFKKVPQTKEITVGVVDVHSHKIEDAKVVRKRIEDIAEALFPEQLLQLWVDPDCGLRMRTEEEAIRKLQVIQEAVRELRLKVSRKQGAVL